MNTFTFNEAKNALKSAQSEKDLIDILHRMVSFFSAYIFQRHHLSRRTL